MLSTRRYSVDSALITPCVLHDVCVICIAKRYDVMSGAAALMQRYSVMFKDDIAVQ